MFSNMSRSIFFFLMLLGFGTMGVGVTLAASPKKVLIVTVTTEFRHSSIPLAEQVLARLAERSGAFTVDFVPQPPGCPKFLFPPKPGSDDAQAPEFQARWNKYEADKRAYDEAYVRWLPAAQAALQALSPANLKNYDAVIFASTTGNLPLPDKQGFIDWVAAGHAFIGLHAAADTFHGFPEFIAMLGGEFLTHGPQVSVDCLNQDPQHAATKHLPASWTVFDEIYQFKHFTRATVHGLLTLDRHPNNGTPGDYPVAWCKKFGQGRVFYTSLGHREDLWAAGVPAAGAVKNRAEIATAYQEHVLGGILWALGLAAGSDVPQTATP